MGCFSLLTILVAVFSLLFGLIGLLKYKNPLYQIIIIFIIVAIYSIRGVGGIALLLENQSFFSLELLYSAIAAVIAYLYFNGGYKYYKEVRIGN